MAQKIAVVALVLLIVLLAIPLGIGVAMSGCPECPAPGTAHALTFCITFASLLMLAFAVGLGHLRATVARAPSLLLVRALERPPRLV